MEQQIRFCKTADGVRIAYSTMGQGPALALVPGWISHLQRYWEHPAAQLFLEKATHDHTLTNMAAVSRKGIGPTSRWSLRSGYWKLSSTISNSSASRFLVFPKEAQLP